MTALSDETSPPKSEDVSPLRAHIRDTVTLAWPVVISRAGAMGIFTVDLLMVGQMGQATEIAYLGLGLALPGLLFMISFGFMQGMQILSSQAYGAEEYEKIGNIWRTGINLCLVLGTIGGLICFVAEDLLLLLGQDADLSAGAGKVAAAAAFGMPGALLYIATGYFLEAIHRPRVGMIVMLIANLLNVGLNLAFIYGWGGWMEPMGAEGAAWATSIVRWVSAALILAYVVTMPAREGTDTYALLKSPTNWMREAMRFGGETGSKLIRLGVGIAFMMTFESAIFQTETILMGYFGEDQLAAYQIGSNTIMLLLMLAIGCSAAAAIRVGNAVGRGDVEEVKYAGWVSGALGFSFAAPGAFFLILFPETAAALYTSDPDVIVIAELLLRLVGVFLLMDSLLAVMVGALRGLGDIWISTALYLVTFWVVGLPLGVYFAFYLELKAPGLYMGLGIASVMSACFAMARFHYKSTRPIARL